MYHVYNCFTNRKGITEKLFSVMFTETEGTNSDSTLVNGISIIMSLLEVKRPIIEGAEELITEMDIERIAQGILRRIII